MRTSRSSSAPPTASGKEDLLRAVGIQLHHYVDAKVDQGLRTRILAVAAKAKAWVVPIFELLPE